MLHHHFFEFSPPQTEGNKVTTQLEIIARHEIFAGHFPDNPVVPGVCMMQMVKEILEHIMGSKTRLVKAGEMKFLAVLNPYENKHPELELTHAQTDDGIRVEARIFNGETIFFKFKGVFVVKLI